MIAELKNSIDLAEIVRGSGIELKSRGAGPWAFALFMLIKHQAFLSFRTSVLNALGARSAAT